MKYLKKVAELSENGHAIINNIYSDKEIAQILRCIESAEQNDSSFLKTKELFAIRQLIKTVPDLAALIFNKNLKDLVFSFSESNYFLTKAIYFDKPSTSNWFVSYHQDLSISVDKRADVLGYKNWTHKKGQYGVQPPLEILQDAFTIRIHLDNTNENNGALRVIPKSHLNGVIRKKLDIGTPAAKEQICKVEKGGIMLMKPLTFHASSRTTNAKRRRVIHLEFNKHQLKQPLKWLEYLDVANL